VPGGVRLLYPLGSAQRWAAAHQILVFSYASCHRSRAACGRLDPPQSTMTPHPPWILATVEPQILLRWPIPPNPRFIVPGGLKPVASSCTRIAPTGRFRESVIARIVAV